MIGSLGFCVTKFVDFAVINILGDHWARARARIVLQSFDFLTLGLILLACRPRKDWPPFFSLTLHEFNVGPVGRNQGGNAITPSTVHTSYITSKLLINDDEDDSRTGDIGKDEAVVFVNPTKYSLE